MRKRGNLFVIGVTIIAAVLSIDLYADEVAAWHRSDQRSFSEIDYENAQPFVSYIKTVAESKSKEKSIGERDIYSIDSTAPVVYGQGFTGTGERDPEILVASVDVLVQPPQHPRDVASTESDISTQEYGRYGDLPYSTSRVDMYGKRVSDTYPYRAIGTLFYNTPNGSAACSASLIKPGLIITAAHCVTRFGGEWFADFEFIPAYYKGEAPYGVWPYEEVRVTQAYKQGVSFCTQPGVSCVDDVAVLKLQEKVGADGIPYSVGSKVGWLGYAFGGLGFSGDLAQVAQFGYPLSHDQGVLMQRTDAPAFINTFLEVVTSSRQTQGSSGGPWIINFGQQAALSDGVTLGEHPDSNLVIAVTSNGVIDNFNKETKASVLTADNFGLRLEEFCPIASTDLACVYNDVGVPSLDEDVLVNLEEPSTGSYSGIGNLQGWAVSQYGIERIEIYIDGEYRFDAPYGGERLDVGGAFPGILGSTNSGFSMAFAYTNLSVGEHTIMAVAVSSAGANDSANQSSSTFTVEKFHKSFIEPGDEVNPAGSNVTTDASGIFVPNLRIDGREYNVKLEWSTATQGFEIVEIN